MLRIGKFSVNDIADRFGTPVYIYDAAVIEAGRLGPVAEGDVVETGRLGCGCGREHLIEGRAAETGAEGQR